MGVKSLSLFGSVARGDQGPRSDIDIAAELDQRGFRIGLLELVRLENHLADILENKVDLLSEPVSRNRDIQAEIDRDRVLVF